MDKKIITGVILALLVGGALMYSVSPNVKEGEKEIQFTLVQKDFHNGLPEKKNVTITDQIAWAKVWGEMSSHQTSQPPLPQIDFSKEMIIGAFMGGKPTGGYNIEITKITESSNEIIVYVREISPGPTCAVTQALTVPYDIVKIPLSSKPVQFTTTQQITDCSNLGSVEQE